MSIIFLRSGAIICFLFGIITAFLFGWPAVLGLGLLRFFKIWIKNRWIYFWMIFFVLGIGRWQLVDFRPSTFSEINDSGERLTVTGQIVAWPEVGRSSTQFVVSACLTDDRCGRVLVFYPNYPQFFYGDIIKITGQLKSPAAPEQIGYQRYLARQNIYSVMIWPEIELIEKNQGNFILSRLFKLKNIFQKQLGIIFFEPEGQLLSGLLLGIKSTFSKDLLNDFQTVGLTHIIVISGSNIALLINFLQFFLRSISWPIKRWLIILSLIIFLLFVGPEASTMRAVIMGSLSVMALSSGRLAYAWYFLCLAVFFMNAWDPTFLLFDVGFQLSAGATAGVILFGKYLEKRLEKIPEIFNLRSSLALTLAAQIFTWPIVYWQFGQLAWLSPLSNILVAPLISPAMLLGFMAILVSFIYLPLGIMLGSLAWINLKLIIFIAQMLANF